MLSESYITSRHSILLNWVRCNTNLVGTAAEELAHHIFLKYYGKCL